MSVWSKMNLPNKLTLLRAALIPFFMFFCLSGSWLAGRYFWALGIFAAASITDFLDGKIARSRNLVTNFGKFMDPLADKALVMAALVCFVELGWSGSIPVVIILAREFMVSGLRMLASGEKVVIAADWAGKLKTAFTMIAIVVIFLLQGLLDAGTALSPATAAWISGGLVWVAAALTLFSGIQYLWGYRKIIDPAA